MALSFQAEKKNISRKVREKIEYRFLAKFAKCAKKEIMKGLCPSRKGEKKEREKVETRKNFLGKK